jgi:hypothetical protein
MASAALIVKADGSFEATPELKLRLQLEPGTRLELVQQDGAEYRFRAPSTRREVKSWRDLEGFLADSTADPNRELDEERVAELRRDSSE